MVFPVREKAELNYQDDTFESVLMRDFTGGLNISDSSIGVKENEFQKFLNLYLERNGTLYTRPPFRPVSFSASIQDKPVSATYRQLITAFADYGATVAGTVKATLAGHGFVDDDVITISGTTSYNAAFTIKKIDANNFYFTDTWVANEADTDSYATISIVPTKIVSYQVFREVVTGWSYDGELHVVVGWFPVRGASNLGIAVYSNTSAAWRFVWSSTDATAMSVTSYKINEAFDLMFFTDTAGPRRWVSDDAGTGYGTVSNVGLTKPADTDFDTTFTAQAAPGGESGFEIAASTNIYYKFAYFYDDHNNSTKYGESAAHAVAGESIVTASVTGTRQMVIAFTSEAIPAGVTKMRIYRAPANTAAGPYRYIGETPVVSVSDVTEFTDDVPWDFEGAECLDDLSNPSTLYIVNPRTIGSYLVGFDATMKYKLVWCTSGQPDVWNPLNYDYLDSDGQAVVEFNRKVYAYTVSGCYQKDTMATPAMHISNIGCVAPSTIQDVGNGLVWMDYDTVYFADYVQQYGSKGDFPKDIGHNISKAVKGYNSLELVNSTFFERRYYLTFIDIADGLRKCFVYDIDFNSWSQHSMNHVAITRGNKKLYSLGIGNACYYVYEHDYKATVPVGSTSTYDGVDYHDYTHIAGGVMAGLAPIVSQLEKDGIQMGGEYRNVFVSSVSLMAEGVYIETDIEITGNNKFSTSKSFSNGALGSNVADTYAAYYGVSVYASSPNDLAVVPADSPNAGDEPVFYDVVTPADADENGYAGYKEGYISAHKKINRVMKSRLIKITVTNRDSRSLKMLGLGFYYKLLPQVA